MESTDELRLGIEDSLPKALVALDRQIWRMAYSWVRDAEEAQDLAQEIRLHVLEKGSGFLGASSAETWIYRVAINVCRDHVRARSRRQAREGELDEELEAAIQDGDAVLAVRAALDCLTSRQRQLLTLREFAGLPYKEIAEVLAISIGTVESGLFDARRRLADRLGGSKGGMG